MKNDVDILENIISVELRWEMLLGGNYSSHGSRFKIQRRRSNEWILTDSSSGKQMRFETLADAKFRTEWIMSQEITEAEISEHEG